MGSEVAQCDWVVVLVRDAKRRVIQILVDVSVQIEHARFDTLHHGCPGNQFRHRPDANGCFSRPHSRPVRDVGPSVAFRECDLPAVDDCDCRPGNGVPDSRRQCAVNNRLEAAQVRCCRSGRWFRPTLRSARRRATSRRTGASQRQPSQPGQDASPGSLRHTIGILIEIKPRTPVSRTTNPGRLDRFAVSYRFYNRREVKNRTNGQKEV